MARIKKVFRTSSEVIHLWANKRQDEAEQAGHFNTPVFFYGKKIYSYGHHYLLGEFITNEKGEEAVYINDVGYSKTTTKHIWEVRSATKQYKQFFETEINDYRVLRTLEGYIERLEKAKKPELYISPANHLSENFDTYRRWVNGGSINDFPLIKAAINAINTKTGNEYFQKKADILEKERIAKLERQKKAQAEQIEKFFAYEVNTVYGLERDFLRISKDEAFVETTQRVRIPLKDAYLFYQLIKAGKNIHGLELKAEYSSYTVIGWENDVLHVGCHHIEKQHVMEVGEKVETVYNFYFGKAE
jgi:hypothetical protein